MKVKQIRLFHCPFCMKAHSYIKNEEEEFPEEVECPYCKRKIDLKSLGIVK